jgi:Flp pilus assembly protein TadD
VGLVDSSRTCFERAVRLEPRRAESHLNLAVLLMRSGVSGRARTEFEQAIECEPGNAFHYWNFAAALADVNKPAPARELLVQALAIDPDNGPAEAEMGRVETMLGQRASALAHFARAESLGVATPTLLTNYGVALVEAGRAQEAEVRLARAVQADSTRAVAWNHLGVARLRQGKVEAAVPPLRQAHRLDPKDEGVRFNLGSALVRLERYQEAVTLLSNPRPQRGDLLGVLGMAQRGARDAGALATLREAADKLPRDPVVLNNYGVALAESGATDRALEVWRRVLEIDPGNATAKSNIEARGGTGR